MVTEEEIEKVTKSMKIDVHDHKEYVEKVHAMINYFNILDSAGVEDEKILSQELPLDRLREDKHTPFGENLIKQLKNYKGRYIRAPKMM